MSIQPLVFDMIPVNEPVIWLDSIILFKMLDLYQIACLGWLKIWICI